MPRVKRESFGRIGRPLSNPGHPIYRWVRVGWKTDGRRTLAAWAEASGRRASTVTSWASGRYPIPEAEALAIQRETRGKVPASAWTAARERWLKQQARAGMQMIRGALADTAAA